MNVISSSYIIIFHYANSASGHGKNVVHGINAMENIIWRGKRNLLVKLPSNDTSKIGMIPSAPKDTPIKFTDQCINIIINKEILNGLKGSTKTQNW